MFASVWMWLLFVLLDWCYLWFATCLLLGLLLLLCCCLCCGVLLVLRLMFGGVADGFGFCCAVV